MSVLSNTSLRAAISAKRIVIEPLGEDAIQPSSIDLRLGEVMLGRRHFGIVDPSLGQQDDYSLGAVERSENGWVLRPGQLYLSSTREYLVVPDDLIAFLHGRSTLARSGVTVHQQAGLLDAGYQGKPTLEISVVYPTVLRPEMPIAQVTFHRLTTAADPVYAGRYQLDRQPTPARLPKLEAS